MLAFPALEQRLRAIAGLSITRDACFRNLTRFAIGGRAALFVRSSTAAAFACAQAEARDQGVPVLVIGGGSNLIVSDSGFRGLVLQWTDPSMLRAENDGTQVTIAAGAFLQSAVDWSMNEGLGGLESLTGIPGFVGGAVYGNAGAYGRSLHELVESVSILDRGTMRMLPNSACDFGYRNSIFKQQKDWTIVEAVLNLHKGDALALRKKAAEIRAIRDAKYPPDMKCAGSIFKNLFFAELPSNVQGMLPPALVRDGKVPSAWFLEQTGVRGLRRGDIVVADYHANLIYNDGEGNSGDLVSVINELKQRVFDRFGFSLEEEVQYVGFNAQTK